MDCPFCGAGNPADTNWCEECGGDLAATPTEPCVACGQGAVSDDGYCMSCGHKQPAQRDHQEFVDGPVVAVSDRGRRHPHNEDAVAIGTTPDGTAVLVVCDGVSSTPGSAEASLAAAGAARDLLIERFSTDPEPDPADALVKAVAVAQEHAAAAPPAEEPGPYGAGGPPSSTFVGAVARPTGAGTQLTVAWVGDSRAYWVGSEEVIRMTDDHEIGGSLIRWLGADSVEPVPDLSHFDADEAGTVVVCSDGMWRYADPPDEMGRLVTALAGESDDLIGVARRMVTHANESGGHDNISVALWSTLPGLSPDGPAPDGPPTDPGADPPGGAPTEPADDPAGRSDRGGADG